MPISNAFSTEQRLWQVSFFLSAVATNLPRHTTTIPKLTQRNTDATVMTPEICGNAAATPMIALAITAAVVQLDFQLQLQLKSAIDSHLPLLFMQRRILQCKYCRNMYMLEGFTA